MTPRAALLAGLLAAAPASLAPLPAAAAADRVVSLNLCTDQFLLALAPGRAAAVTFLARDPALSVMAAAAARVPVVRADAEAVLALRPDLVLAGPWGAQATLRALERRGIPVERVVPPQDFPAIRRTTLRMAAVLGAEAEARRRLAEMDAILAALPPPSYRPAIALEPRGWTAGPDSLRGAVLRAAGFVNAAAGEQFALERLAVLPPLLLVLAPPPATRARATELLAHPALHRHARITLPAAPTVCGGPWTAAAVARLAG